MRQRTITISRDHVRALKRHAEDAGSCESCALLFGTENRVKDIFLAENADESPERSFTIPPAQLIDAYKTTEDRGLEVVGIFHSHPASQAFPSKTDIQFMNTNPVVWVIYSSMSGQFNAYMLDGSDQIQNIVIEIAA